MTLDEINEYIGKRKKTLNDILTGIRNSPLPSPGDRDKENEIFGSFAEIELLMTFMKDKSNN